MNTMVLLTLLSVLGASALFIALSIFLNRIVDALEAIGGSPKAYGNRASVLSRIRMGVRAIETQTGGLVPQVTQLNTQLSAVRDGVKAIDGNLGGVITAVTAQEAP